MALPIFIGEKMAKHILSCSFGKDSIATALLALQHGEPLDELKLPEIADKLSKHITLIPLQEIHSHAADGDS